MNKISIKIFLALLFSAVSLASYSQDINTIGGDGIQGFSGNGGQATSAELSGPGGNLVADRSGNIYFGDQTNAMIRMITSAGIISTIAGNGITGYSGDGGPALNAEFSQPTTITFDSAQNMYVVDTYNNVIRKVNTSGIISTFAGNGIMGNTGDGSLATAAELNWPSSVIADDTGNIYIADSWNNVIRKVNTSGVIRLFAGNFTAGYSGDGGTARGAELNKPFRIIFDRNWNMYVADAFNNRIREVSASGTITTIAGNGIGNFSGDGGQATSAEINSPYGVCADFSGNIYIADASNERIREVNTSGVISTFAGNGAAAFGGDGGPATVAEINFPTGVSTDYQNNIYINDYNNNRLRKITLSTLSVLANTTINPGCNGGSNGSASVTTSGGTAPYTYSWSPNGGSSSTASTLSAGIYTITVTDNSGLTNSATVTITQPTPLAFTTSTNVTNCYGSSNGSATVVVSGGTGAYTYSWVPSGQLTPTATGLSAGIYTVLITDANGCKDSTIASISQPATLAASPGVLSNTCYGTSSGSAIVSVSGGTGAYTYVWTPSAQTTNNATGLSAGAYTITVTDANGCTVISIATITQAAQLFSSATGPSVCSGQTDTLTSSESGGTEPYTYAWSPSGGNAATGFVVPVTSTTYTLSVTDANGCATSAFVAIIVAPSPAASFYASPDTLIGGGTVSFVNLTTGANSFYWNFGDGTASADSSVSHEYDKTGVYIVEMVATNSLGCRDTLTRDIYVTGLILVPNVFTPNGDGMNDKFIVTAEGMETFTIQIYNRWGEEVFESDSPLPALSWTGLSVTGEMESSGTYYYYILASDYSGKKYNLKGYLELIR